MSLTEQTLLDDLEILPGVASSLFGEGTQQHLPDDWLPVLGDRIVLQMNRLSVYRGKNGSGFPEEDEVPLFSCEVKSIGSLKQNCSELFSTTTEMLKAPGFRSLELIGEYQSIEITTLSDTTRKFLPTLCGSQIHATLPSGLMFNAIQIFDRQRILFVVDQIHLGSGI